MGIQATLGIRKRNPSSWTIETHISLREVAKSSSWSSESTFNLSHLL